MSVFEGVPAVDLQRVALNESIDITEFLTTHTNIFPSKGEARRMLKDKGVSINKEKVKDDAQIGTDNLLNGKYILVQKGKKNYFFWCT